MEYNFEENRYFGHATDVDPNYIIENGLNIYMDVYGKKNLSSTTIEITEEDLTTEEDMLKNVFSLGINNYRKYVVIIACNKQDFNSFNNELINNSNINPEYICGYYDESFEFYPNYDCIVEEEKKYH